MLLREDAGFPNRKDHAEISGTFKQLSQMAFIVPTQIEPSLPHYLKGTLRWPRIQEAPGVAVVMSILTQ